MLYFTKLYRSHELAETLLIFLNTFGVSAFFLGAGDGLRFAA